MLHWGMLPGYFYGTVSTAGFHRFIFAGGFDELIVFRAGVVFFLKYVEDILWFVFGLDCAFILKFV